jgi:hypothetical protein
LLKLIEEPPEDAGPRIKPVTNQERQARYRERNARTYYTPLKIKFLFAELQIKKFFHNAISNRPEINAIM